VAVPTLSILEAIEFSISTQDMRRMKWFAQIAEAEYMGASIKSFGV
jgi:hypothetical protein